MTFTKLPSAPPLLLCSTSTPERISEWACEDRMWPGIHSIVIFIVYYYIRQWYIVLLIAYLYETLEVSIAVGANDLLSEEPESLGGVMISEPLMAVFGIIISELYSKLINFEYERIPRVWNGYQFTWIKIIVQVLIYFAATLLYWVPENYFADGVYSAGYIYLNFHMPVFFYIFAIWNYKEPIWKYSGEFIYNRVASTVYPFNVIKRDKKVEERIGEFMERDKYLQKHLYYSIFIFFYMLLYHFRWTHVFVMAVIYNSVIIVAILGYMGFNQPM